MTAMDIGLSGPPATIGGRAMRHSLDLMVAEDPRLVASWWRCFETRATGSPYQRMDWVCAYLDTLGKAEGETPRIVVGRDADGATALVLPLTVRRSGRVRIAGPVGGAHANYHMPLWRPGAAFGDPAAILAAIGRLVGADAVALPFAPRHWGGEPNPLVPAGAPASVSSAHRLTLDATGEETLTRVLSRDARKKLRQKAKGLAEHGPLALRQATTPEEVEGVLATFFAHKAERRRSIGLPNPFEASAARDFLRRACLAGLEAGTPAVELYGLHAGERIVATFAGAAQGRRLSGMVLSFDAGDAEIARRSPGDLLLNHLVEEQCRRGRTILDLGVGEARYKDTFCDGVDDLADVLVPVTPVGHAYAALAAVRRRGKRFVKQTPWAWSLVTRMRRKRAGGE